MGNPLRLLDKSTHGGLGPGNLGVIMARAGVGKTAVLVQIGLDDLMRDRRVLHVALGETVEHVERWYTALFGELAARSDLEDRPDVETRIAQNRIIAAFPDHDLWPERLQHTAELFERHLAFRPAAVLVDGFDWTRHTVPETAALLGAFKAYARAIGAELWMTAQTHRSATGDHPNELTAPCSPFVKLIDLALFLEPKGRDIAVRVLKNGHGHTGSTDPELHLLPGTLRLVAPSVEP